MQAKVLHGDLSKADIEDLLAVLSQENRKRRRARRSIMACFLGGALILVLTTAAVCIVKHQPPDLTTLGTIPVLFGVGAAFTAPHKEALKRLAELETKEHVGFLVEAYTTTDEREVKDLCLAALPAAIAKADDPQLFDDYQRGLFYRLLNVGQPAELVVAVLEAVGRIGGPESIPYLEQFRSSALNHRDPHWQRLGEKVLLVLPAVRIRAARTIIETKVQETDAELTDQIVRLEAFK